MDFGFALTHLRMGAKVKRQGWLNYSDCIWLQQPDFNSGLVDPFICSSFNELYGVQKKAPWTPSNADLFALDWTLV